MRIRQPNTGWRLKDTVHLALVFPLLFKRGGYLRASRYRGWLILRRNLQGQHWDLYGATCALRLPPVSQPKEEQHRLREAGEKNFDFSYLLYLFFIHDHVGAENCLPGEFRVRISRMGQWLYGDSATCPSCEICIQISLTPNPGLCNTQP